MSVGGRYFYRQKMRLNRKMINPFSIILSILLVAGFLFTPYYLIAEEITSQQEEISLSSAPSPETALPAKIVQVRSPEEISTSKNQPLVSSEPLSPPLSFTINNQDQTASNLSSQFIWHTNSVFYAKPLTDIMFAAQNDNPEANYELGLRIYNSSSQKKEIKHAISHIEKAAALNYPEAQLWVAKHYERGSDYYPKNYRQAFLWAQKAADLGHPEAQYFLSLLYIAGRGVEPNSTESAYWAYTAAGNKYPPAMTRIGILYQEGLGVPQNSRNAILWFLRGALYNDALAQYYLGICYSIGFGVKANQVEAYKWLNISASKGNAKALNMRQKLIKRMTVQQIREGQELSSKFIHFIQNQGKFTDLDPLAANMPIENTISGFFITTDGHILTSYQPLIGHTALYARTSSGYFKAEIVLADVHNNIALLKIDNQVRSIVTNSLLTQEQPIATIGNSITPLALAPTASFTMGAPIFTIGFSDFDKLAWNPALVEGNIKGLSGIKDDPRYLKIGMIINSQNTGAPIITASGEVIGILDISADENFGSNSLELLQESTSYRNAIRSQYAFSLFETLPEVKNKLLPPPEIQEQKFNASVAEAMKAIVQIIIY